jgi:hypothetical protein
MSVWSANYWLNKVLNDQVRKEQVAWDKHHFYFRIDPAGRGGAGCCDFHSNETLKLLQDSILCIT